MKWEEKRIPGRGTFFTGTVARVKYRLFFYDDGRKQSRVWRWESKRKVWIRELNPATAIGLLTIKRTAKQMKLEGRTAWPSALVRPFTDPRTMRVNWAAVERGPDGYARLRNPDHTIRPTSNVQTLAPRGQRGNRQRQGR